MAAAPQPRNTPEPCDTPDPRSTPEPRSTPQRKKPTAPVVAPRDAARRHAAAFVQTVADQVALFTPPLGGTANEITGRTQAV